MMAGDCPSFFPLPGLTPGSEHYVAQHGPLPDHVHKSGGHGGDQTQVCERVCASMCVLASVCVHVCMRASSKTGADSIAGGQLG